MKRREFLKQGSLGTAATAVAGAVTAASTLPRPAIAQTSDVISWRCTSSFPKSLDTIFGGAMLVSKLVEDMSDGKFKISVFPAGEIVPALQALDSVQNGAIEMAHTTSYYYVGKDMTFALGTAIPFGLNARQQNAWLHEGGGAELLNKFYADYNVVGLAAGNTGTQMGGWWRNEIKSLADLKGVKIRIAGIGGQIMADLGAVPQQIPGSDIYQSLEKGTIDAAEWVGPYDDEKLGFHQIVKNYYYPGWWEAGPTIHMMINREKFNALPKPYQTMLKTACAQANQTMLAQYDIRNIKALRSLLGQGIQLRPYPADVIAAAWQKAQDLYAGLSASNKAWQPIYESLHAWQNDSVRWMGISDMYLDSLVARQMRKAQPK